MTDGVDTPLGVVLSAATEHESKNIEALTQDAVVKLPAFTRLIYDKAADNDALRSSLSRRGIELICAHKKNRKKRRLQDGRKLRRSRHRWKIERTISWLKSYRRLSTRYEHYADLFLGFAQLACMFTILKRF